MQDKLNLDHLIADRIEYFNKLDKYIVERIGNHMTTLDAMVIIYRFYQTYYHELDSDTQERVLHAINYINTLVTDLLANNE